MSKTKLSDEAEGLFRIAEALEGVGKALSAIADKLPPPEYYQTLEGTPRHYVEVYAKNVEEALYSVASAIDQGRGNK